MRISISLLVLSACWIRPSVAGAASPGYGVPVDGMPSWRERSLQVFTNACRMDPTGFRDAYLNAPAILTPAVYPRTFPVYWDQGLNEAARAHAADLGSHPDCPLSHRSCDGTSFLARLKLCYPDSLNVGENVAAGSQEPLTAMVLWLRDDFGSGPPPDGQGDSNRFIIMSPLFREVGGGHAQSSGVYQDYWVQDFGGGAPVGNPLVDGTHALAQGEKIAFFANFYDPTAGNPRSADLVLEGQTLPMALFLGTGSQGTYQVRLDRVAHCRSYFFSFEGGNGRAWRYPEAGQFLTVGEGICAGDYSPSPETRHGQLAGDCNQDGTMDLSDSLCFLGALFLGIPARFPCGGGSSSEESNVALLDVNGDGRIDIADAIVRHQLPVPRRPAPAPGTGLPGDLRLRRRLRSALIVRASPAASGDGRLPFRRCPREMRRGSRPRASRVQRAGVSPVAARQKAMRFPSGDSTARKSQTGGSLRVRSSAERLRGSSRQMRVPPRARSGR